MEELSKYERRKQIKEQEKQSKEKKGVVTKMSKYGLILALVGLTIWGVSKSLQKPPEQVQLEEELKTVNLEGRLEEFEIEGRTHVEAGASVEYETNPPTSGDHLAEAEKWGINGEEIDDLMAVHSLEHGGIWISYKDISEEERLALEEVWKANPLSTLVSPRSANENRIVIASWGRMMKLDEVDKVLIQKYIESYKNDSPEKLAR